MRKLLVVSAGLGVLGLADQASANAFLFTFFDAKAVGRGNAATATSTAPSSIAYNVGGLAARPGTSVTLGGSLIVPEASYTDLAGVRTDAEPSHPVIPHVFLSSRINDMLAAGIGFHAPFGLAISWPDAAPTNDVAKSQELATYFITPSIGVNLGAFVPGLTVGAGLDLVPATIEVTKVMLFGETQGRAQLGGDAFGVGGRIGAMYTPAALPALSVGAMWRSQVDEDFTGKADFDVADPYRSQAPPDGDISSSVSLPQSLSIGAAYRPTPALELEADVLWVNWSKVDELRIAMPDLSEAAIPLAAANTVTLSLGAEYELPRRGAAVRVGYIYDPAALPDTTLAPLLPDTDHHELTAGASYRLGDYDVHASVLYAIPQPRDTSDVLYAPAHKGTYELAALVTSLTLEGHFGR